MVRDGIRDDQGDRIKDRLPGRVGHVGVTARDNRLFINGVLYRYPTGIPWRDLPEEFGNFQNIHRRFGRWAEKGMWNTLLSLLTEDADEEYVMITLVRAHQHSSGAAGRNSAVQAIGRSRGGLTTKIHARTDALGTPTAFLLTPGQIHALAGAEVLLTDLVVGAVIADKAYDADHRVVQPLEQAGMEQAGIEVVIPPRSQRKAPRNYDRELYEARHLYKARHLIENSLRRELIENFFCKLKPFRGIATRYDQLSRNFLAAIQFAAILIWLN